MFDVDKKPQMVERALLVCMYEHKEKEEESDLLLDELEELVATLGIEVVSSSLAYVRAIQKTFWCGSGKAEEICSLAHAHQCDCIVFDNLLSPSQQRNWERLAAQFTLSKEGSIIPHALYPEGKLLPPICVIDREEVILDIFSQRAQTKEARLQVDLARMEYSLPRLARMWGHLDREGGGGSGGGGASRGMGEQQIEIDRRLARTRIDQCKRELAEVRKHRQTQRKEREKQGLPTAAIAGYTNAGKSTLLNALSGANVLAKDMLFATLDTTTRQIDLPDGQKLLCTDTVGFVRNLPHRLVEAFKATLEEVALADFIIHVLDASDPQVETFYHTTLHVLGELGASDKPMITVLNKADCLKDTMRLDVLELSMPNAVVASAKRGEGLDEILTRCTLLLANRLTKQCYAIPQSRGDLIALLYNKAQVLETVYRGNDVLFEAVAPPPVAGKLTPFICEPFA